MKQSSTIFLQAVVILIAMVALALLIRIPQTEGRAQNLDLLSIYTDPFILYGYAASVSFFVALYKAFRFLGYIRQDETFSLRSVNTVRNIKQCAVALGILIVAAGIYIMFFHAKEDDPAGFLGLCIATTFASVVVAVAASVLENILQHGAELKQENQDLKK